MAIIPTKKYTTLPVDELPLLDLITNAAAALRSKSANDWCKLYYDRPLSVFCGSDPDNPPGEASYPLVELFPLEDDLGLEPEESARHIGVAIGIHNEKLETVVYNDLEMAKGVLHCENLYKLALADIAAADLLGGYLGSARAARDPETLHPFYLIGAEIIIKRPLGG